MAMAGLALGVNWYGVGISLRAGAVVAGRYRLDRLLGQGGMGLVWAATHTVTRREVAMKFVNGPARERSELRRRFLREARASASVQHPNVVSVLDVFELDHETPVMVMDLLSGETLGERIEREEKLSLEETAAILLPVISAVGTAHARGIVHRDLTPENIFLAESDEGVAIKVLDFGIAKLTSESERSRSRRGPVTQRGATLGTPCYMAPEQATAESEIDHRVDVWALGVILYECLSGIRPIDGDTVGQVVMRLMSTGITPLERVVLGLPEDVTQLVGRMLSRERARRPSDLREAASVLSRYTEVKAPEFGAPESELDTRALPLHEDDEALTTSTVHNARSRRLLAALGVLTLGLGAWMIRPSPREVAPPAVAVDLPPPAAAIRAPRSAPAPTRASVPLSSSAPPSSDKPRTRVVEPRVRARSDTPPAPSANSATKPLPGLAETPPF